MLLSLVRRARFWWLSWLEAKWAAKWTELRQWRARRQAARAAASDRPIFETLEPKLLLSADLMPVGPSAELAVHRLVDVVVDGIPTVQNQALGSASRSLADSQGIASLAAAVPTVSVTGPGTGQLVAQAGGYLLQLTGTSTATSVAVSVSDGSRLALAGISANSAVGALNLANADLSGTASFSGSLGSLTLGQVRQSTINVVGGGELSFKAASVVDTRLSAPLANLSVAVSDWVSSTAGASRIESAGLKALSTTGDLGIDLFLSGQPSGFTLGSAQVGGAITGGLWSVHGRASSISAGSTGAVWRLNSSSTLAQLITKGDASGYLAVAGLQTLQVGGSIRGMTLLVGADLGDDASLGGSGANADTFKPGTLARLRVVGDVVDSNLFVSVDPVNSTLADGNDRQIGTPVQRVQELAVGGQLLGSTHIAAPSFPTSVRIGGQTLNPATVAQLSAVPPDTVAPVILSFNLAPASDTDTVGDNRTTQTVVALVGVTEAGAALSLRRSGSATVLASGTADATGAFSLGNITLDLGDNNFALTAADAAGNSRQSSLVVVREAVPDIDVPTLTARLARDNGKSASDRITNDPTIVGQVADNIGVTQLLVALDPTGDAVSLTNLMAIVEAGGGFTITRAKLDELAGGTLSNGAHTLRLIAKDAAGNSSTPVVNLSFTLDTLAPSGASFAVSSADAVDGNDSQTSAAIATLRGTAEAGSTITLTSQGLATTASGSGAFQLPGVAFATGDNTITLSVTDAAGNSQNVARTITRVPQTKSDQVLIWNNVALQAIQRDVTDPPVATRILAIQSVAVYDALAAIEGTPAFLVQRSISGAVSADAAAAYAAYEVLYQLYPGQRDALNQAIQTSLATIPDGAAKTAGIALGRDIADAVLAIRASDGYLNFATDDGGTAVGQWRPTGPMFLVAQDPQWKDVTPFVLTSGAEFRAPPPPALDSPEYAAAINEVQSLGSATSTTRTADQTEQALFWQDGGGSYTPPGHWNQIAAQVAAQKGYSLSANARLMAELNVALADAAIACWDTKYTYDAWRPVTAIQEADADGNAATAQDAAWRSFLINPPHPDYVSGHSTFSAAAAGVLAATFGDNTAFSTTSTTLPGVTRSFTSFSQAANEAGMSRIYGGIHTSFANTAGQAIGAQVATAVLARFDLTEDLQAPSVVVAATKAVTNANLTLTGQVLDNLSGVVSAQWRLDNGDLQPFVFDATGRFTLTTALLLDGSQDGGHTLTLIAKDAAGNISAGYTRSFTLDTKAPVLTLASVADGDLLTAATRLTGSSNPTGGTLAQLTYSVDGGTARNLIFDATTSAFDEALALGNLGIGSHTLSLSAADAAGNITTLSRSVTLDALGPFIVSKVTPSAGSGDVGTTFRPQVYFSRAVDPATLTAATFYATGPDGSVLPTTLVPASDGSFVWMFFNGPMPGASQVTLHLKGSSIHAAQGGTLLDADGNGTAGGDLNWGFTTVSTSSVLGATLVGKVVDPGPDLKPMTFDDILRGPDGIIHTADDVFLNPIVHAKVFIVGRPDLFTYTDAQGNFSFTDMPVDDVKVGVDGRTATNAPAGVFWPEMVMDVTVRPGIENTLMGGMGTRENQEANFDRREVYLPRVQTSSLQAVSNNVPTTITVDDKSAPGLTDEQRSQLTLTVKPGTAVGSDGTVLTNVQIGISTVPSELVKDMLPPGVLQHTFDITIQAPSVDTFTEPVKITSPNIFNAAPGTTLQLLSFDHTTGSLVISGTGTISPDGKYVTSNAGSGVLAPGWHGWVEPSVTDKRPVILPTDRDIGVMDCDPEQAAEANHTVDLGLSYARLFAPDPATTTDPFGDDLSLTNSLYRLFRQGGVDPTVGINYDETSIAAQKVKASRAFAAFNSSIEQLINLQLNLIILSGREPTNLDWLAIATSTSAVRGLAGVSLEFNQSDSPDLYFSIHGTQGVDIELRPVSRATGIIGYEINYKIHDYFRFGDNDAALPGNLGAFLSACRYLQMHCGAAAFPIQIEVSEVNFANVPDGPDVAARTASTHITNPRSSLASLVQSAAQVQQGIGPNNSIYYKYEFADGNQISGVSNASKAIQAVLPPNTAYTLFTYAPRTNSWGVNFAITPAAGGSSTGLLFPSNPVLLQTTAELDSDGDGLPDVAEIATGTRIDVADTDLDGINDFEEIRVGLDPFGGRGLSTGVVASLQLRGEAREVVLAGSISASEAQFGYVATGSYGLAIVDASQFQATVVLSELDLPGSATGVAIDAQLKTVAVAANGGGLILIDITDKTQPRLLRTINVEGSTVEAFSGVVYATVGAEVRSYDMLTGERLDTAHLGSNTLIGLAREGSTLYALDSARRLTAIGVAEGEFTIKGSITLAQSNGKLFVGGGIAYVGAGNGTTGGFSTVDVSDAGAPRLLSGVDANNVQGSMVVANGSGLGIAIGTVRGPQGQNISALDVLNVSDPTSTANFITRINLPADPFSVRIGAGIAFVANGTAGLQVVNYRSFDNLGRAPTLNFTSSVTDLDPAAPGVQVQEGTRITVTPTVTDDVQVRNVELLVNGQVVGNDVSFPFELSTVLPTLAQNGSSVVTLQVRATDTGGNRTISAPLVLDLQPDTTAPRITSITPVDGAVRGSEEFRAVRIGFSEAIDAATPSFANIQIIPVASPGAPVIPTNLQVQNEGRSIVLTFDELPSGTYDLVILANQLTDIAGNAVDSPPIVHRFNVIPGTLTGSFSGLIDRNMVWADTSKPYLINGSLEIAAGATLTVARDVQVIVDTGARNQTQTLTVNGTLVLDNATSLTLVQRNNTTVSVKVNGTLRTSNTKIVQSVPDGGGFTSVDVNAGGRLVATNTLFELPVLSFVEDSVFNAGDLTGNTFKTTLVTPVKVVPLLDDNKQFQVVQVRGGTLSTDMSFKALGTATTVGMYFQFIGNFTVAAGATMTAAPNAVLVVDTGARNQTQALTVNGTLVLDNATSLTLVQRNNTSVSVKVNGTLRTSNTKIVQSVPDGGGFTSVDVNAGGRLIAANTLFELPVLSLVEDSVFNAGDLTGNTFKTTLVTPVKVVPLLDDNKQFQVVQVRGGTLSTDMSFKALGTATTVGMYFQFIGNFTVAAGATMTAAPNAVLVVDTGARNQTQALTVNGTLVLDNATSLTLVQRNNTSVSVKVNGTLRTSNTKIVQSVPDGGGFTSVDVNAGGRLIASNTVFDMPTVSLASGSLGSIQLSTLGTKLLVGGPSNVEFRRNTLTDSTVESVGDAASTIDMRQNWWGTTDPVVIELKIAHRSDSALRPLVDFGGFLLGPPN